MSVNFDKKIFISYFEEILESNSSSALVSATEDESHWECKEVDRQNHTCHD